MKTFKDLVFEDHRSGNGKQAKCFFKNGYGVSVVRFKIAHSDYYGSYTDSENEWELAVLFGDKNEWEISYSTPFTDDVLGHLTSEEVKEYMIKIQDL